VVLQHADYIENDWGTGKSVGNFAPSMVVDATFKTWWGKFERLGATPGAAVALMRMNSQIDISAVLPTNGIPSLVIHRERDVLIDVEGGRFLAEKIPGAHYVELPGSDHLPYIGDNSDSINAAIREFLSSLNVEVGSPQVLTTLLVALAVDDTDAAPETAATGGRATVPDLVARYRGRLLQDDGCGFTASFDGPTRAIQCATAVVTGSARNDRGIRIGVHTGEVDLVDKGLSGRTNEIARSIARYASPGEVLISRTVRDLVAGSGLIIEECSVDPGHDHSVLPLYRISRHDR
jgi:hypothetical protein